MDISDIYFDTNVFRMGQKLFAEKCAKVEEILTEFLKCRSWQEIATHGNVVYHTDAENNPQETWYFKDTMILTVTLTSSGDTMKFNLENHVGENG